MRKIISGALAVFALAGCMSTPSVAAPPMMVGGYAPTEVTNPNVINAANFAVSSEQQTLTQVFNRPVSIKLLRIDQATQQVVAGINYKMQLSLIINGEQKQATAVVYLGLGAHGEMELKSWDSQ
jgi:hypothetical protein